MDEFDVRTLHGRRATARWNRLSVGDVFERLTWSRPDQDALVAAPGACAGPEWERLTFAEADALANRLANAMLARGLQRSDRVLLFCDNSVEAMLAKIAVAKAGLVAAPINTMMAPDVVAHLIGHIEPRFAIVDAELWPRVEQAFMRTGLTVDVTIEIGGPPVAGSVGLAAFAASGDAGEPVVEIAGDDIWELLFTSGTTAMPKAVMISHTYTHLAGQNMALSLTRGLRWEGELRLCSFLPVIFHSGDQVFAFATFVAGGTLIIGRRPDPVAIAHTVAKERATGLWGGSPAMLGGLASALEADPGLDVRALTLAQYGWGALPPETLATLKRHAGPEFQVVAIFGQTEAISCHRFPIELHQELYERVAPLENYVGQANALLGAKIIDPSGAEIPRDQLGVAGEVVYRSPIVCGGYFRDEQATAEAFRDGWFHSGDSLVHGEDGQRVMVDRSKDIVKSGGENVSSLRVEAVLMGHPDVTGCAVIGLAHERWGEAVTALVVLRDGAELDEAAMIAFARERLGGFETPKAVVAIDELPATVGGKVLKHKLRATYASYYASHQAL